MVKRLNNRLTFRPRIPERKCTFRWLSHKRHRFGNRTRFGNLGRKCTRDKVGGSGNQRNRAGKCSRPSKDGTQRKKYIVNTLYCGTNSQCVKFIQKVSLTSFHFSIQCTIIKVKSQDETFLVVFKQCDHPPRYNLISSSYLWLKAAISPWGPATLWCAAHQSDAEILP